MQSPRHNGNGSGSLFDRFSTRKGIPVEVEILTASETDPPFIVFCLFVDGKELEEIVEASMVRGRTGQMEADNERYRKQFVKKYFTGWIGLTLGNFIRLLPGRASMIDAEAWFAEFPDGEMPFSEKAALDLYRETTVEMFFNKVRDSIAAAAKYFSEQKALEVMHARKNSGTSPDSSVT